MTSMTSSPDSTQAAPSEAKAAKPSPWHVSPLIDFASYGFSWLWILVPLVLLGPSRPDYLGWYLFAVILTDVHRMFGLPYVFMDSAIRRSFPYRFHLFTGVLFAAFIASPLLVRAKVHLQPAGIAAIVLGILLLLQLIRRDGSDQAATGSDFVKGVVAPYLLAGCTFLGLRTLTPDLDPAWAFVAAGLFAAGSLDLRLARRAVASSQAIRPRFITPVTMLAIIVATLVVGEVLGASGGNAKGIPFASVYAVIATFAILWNFWHVYMQKYGIFRMYNAKAMAAAGQPGGSGVPGWVDRALVFAWLPLFFSWLGPIYRDLTRRYFSRSKGLLEPLLDLLESQSHWLVPLCFSLLFAAVINWLVFEWRAYRLRNHPRLWMAAGTMLINAAFLVFDPVKVYLAFAFSHAVEYMVFVWAFQRRRYEKPLDHRPLLARCLKHPMLAYLGFIIVVGAAYFCMSYWGRYIFEGPFSERPKMLGVRTAVWMSYWGIYQSIQHFYFDGFLWKMRQRSVRENL